MRNKLFIKIVITAFILVILTTTSSFSQLNNNETFEDNNYFNESFIQNLSKGEKVDVIVVFTGKINNTLLNKSGANVKENMESIDASTITATKEVIQRLQNDTNIESIEPDLNLELFGEENSIILNEQTIPWGVERTNAPKVWNNLTGKNVKIAIIDSGINKNHSDLINNLKGGISFINNSDYFNDDLGHGTSVAGVIGALNNNIGIIGVAPEAELYSVKVISASGGKLSDFIQGIQWATDNHMNIIVMSLGIPVDSPSVTSSVP